MRGLRPGESDDHVRVIRRARPERSDRDDEAARRDVTRDGARRANGARSARDAGVAIDRVDRNGPGRAGQRDLAERGGVGDRRLVRGSDEHEQVRPRLRPGPEADERAWRERKLVCDLAGVTRPLAPGMCRSSGSRERAGSNQGTSSYS